MYRSSVEHKVGYDPNRVLPPAAVFRKVVLTAQGAARQFVGVSLNRLQRDAHRLQTEGGCAVAGSCLLRAACGCTAAGGWPAGCKHSDRGIWCVPLHWYIGVLVWHQAMMFCAASLSLPRTEKARHRCFKRPDAVQNLFHCTTCRKGGARYPIMSLGTRFVRHLASFSAAFAELQCYNYLTLSRRIWKSSCPPLLLLALYLV